jgi:type VI secretion system protein ImpB
MAKDSSVAPQERINITYKSTNPDMPEDIELPLKMLFLGDYTNREDPRALEDRLPVNIDKDNFDDVLEAHKLKLDISVADKMSGQEDGKLSIALQFKKLSDFGPEAIAQQMPEIRSLLELRKAISSLKGPLGNVPAFRRKIQELLKDEGARDKLMKELNLSKDGG